MTVIMIILFKMVIHDIYIDRYILIIINLCIQNKVFLQN
jgi:hypothetical protein